MAEPDPRCPPPARSGQEVHSEFPGPVPTREDEPTLPSRWSPSEAQPQSRCSCLEVDEALAFVAGHLKRSDLSPLHQHLDSCERCQRLVHEANRALEEEAGQTPNGWSTVFQAGALIAQRYRICRFIARGGMGEVYEAFDQVLRERVALKTVASTGSDSPRAVRHLKAEVQLARRVSHPNVCRIYDLGAHTPEPGAGVVHFLTMEFVSGETLADRIRHSGALPVGEALCIARQLLCGLGVAHDAGILHRDLKSANVMLRAETDRAPSAVIMDFGLARQLDAEAVRQLSATSEGLVGTLSYMAPEQVEGGALSTGSDIYAFGVVLFELLTGQLPFTARAWAPAVLDRLTKLPAPPSSHNQSVPKSLDAIVLRCLAPSPADRFHTAGEVLAAFDCIESPEATLRPLPPRRWGIRAAALGVTTLVAGLLGMWTHPHSSEPAASPSPAAVSSATALMGAPPAPPDREGASRLASERTKPDRDSRPTTASTQRVTRRPRAPRSHQPRTAAAAADAGVGVKPVDSRDETGDPDAMGTPKPASPRMRPEPDWEKPDWARPSGVLQRDGDAGVDVEPQSKAY